MPKTNIMKLSEEEIARRSELSKDLFRKGFNCSQAVVAACSDLYGVDQDLAMRFSASFGGGIGRMRLTCGAACGMFVLAGLENGNTIPNEPNRKLINYELVRLLAQRFEQENGGLVCAELIGLTGNAPKQKRPCPEMIAEAVKIYLSEIAEQ